MTSAVINENNCLVIDQADFKNFYIHPLQLRERLSEPDFLDSNNYQRLYEPSLLDSNIKPFFWRAPTDNDLGNNMHDRCAVWKEAHNEFLLQSIDTVKINNTFTIHTKFFHNETQCQLEIDYRVYGNGLVLIKQTLFPPLNPLPELPRYGMKMTLPERFQYIEWFGRGLHESYWDRKFSASIGKYKGTVKRNERI